jgi:SAM-dependent methyltransferase
MDLVHFTSYYRWIVATEYLGLPRHFSDAVLDIGSGKGNFLSRIAAPLKLGIDVAVPESPLAPLIQADACRLPFPDCAFGHVLAFDILEHVEDDRSLVAEAFRVLAQGGAFWLSTPADGFILFPGGAAQERMHRSWGHVRRGYARDDLFSRFPNASIEATLFAWNEPFLRMFYFPLKMLFNLVPSSMPRVVPWIVALDASHRQGEAGHFFAHVVKCS